MLGFISLNGNDLVMLSDFYKSDDMIAFLELIRKQNPDRPLCIFVLDIGSLSSESIISLDKY